MTKTTEEISGEVRRAAEEARRIAIEETRLLYERHRTFYEQWRTDLEPRHEARLLSRELASTYAKAAIQTSFYLNGGALVAFPTFAKLVNADFESYSCLFIGSIVSFIVGLVLVAATNLLAYLTMEMDSQGMGHEIAEFTNRLNEGQDPENKKANWVENRTAAKYKKEFYWGIGKKLNLWAVVVCGGSLIAFIVGCYMAITFISKTPTINL